MVTSFRSPRAAATLIVACAAALSASPLAAQQTVGTTPENSPYHDIQSPQRITVYGGYFIAGKDPKDVAPNSAPLLGARYEVTVGGPAQFFVRFARTFSQRKSYDPTKPAATRDLGTVNDPIYLADVGFSFNLIGQRTWHSIVPTAGFALGVASATNKAPNDPYSFGTQFAMSTEFGIRYKPSSSFEARVTAGNTLYQTKYPNPYFVNGPDGTPVLDGSKSSYRNNWVFTGGLSFPVFR